MSWSYYTRPDGTTVSVWPVTDQNDTPEGAIAGVGQIVVKEKVIFEGNPIESAYVMDAVPSNWKLDGSLPDSVPANESIKFQPPPEQYLFEMSLDQLRRLAASHGLEMRKGAIKRDYVKAIYAFDLGEGTDSVAPEGPETIERIIEPAFAAPGGGLVAEDDDEA
jgi:hypothetical protein